MRRTRSRGKRGQPGAGTVAGALAVTATVVALLLSVRDGPACDPAPAGPRAESSPGVSSHNGSSC